LTDSTRAPADEIGDDATTEVTARAREALLTTVGTLLPYAAGAALLFLEPRTWSAETWIGVTVFVLAALGVAVWQYGTERGRQDQAQRLLAEYAVLRHVDPGVGRRGAADETATGFVRGRCLGWLLTLGLVAIPLTAGQWDHPSWAVPGAVLLGITAAVQLTAREREARAGRRWLADPPGPLRD
jgi:hypothetical protein